MAATNVIYIQKNPKSMSYNYIDKDPVCDMIREAIRYAREEHGMSLEEISAKAMVSWTTIHNLDIGKTRRPWNQTAQRILEACGYRRPIIKAMFDASGKELDPAKMHKALVKIINSKNLSTAEMISIARMALGVKR